MKLKPGVNITGIRNEMLWGVMAAQRVYDTLNVEMVVTSALDGKHSATSLHYAGAAVDLRINNFPTRDYAKDARDLIAAALPNDFDVILEGNHIHLEYQPRYRG